MARPAPRPLARADSVTQTICDELVLGTGPSAGVIAGSTVGALFGAAALVGLAGLVKAKGCHVKVPARKSSTKGDKSTSYHSNINAGRGSTHGAL